MSSLCIGSFIYSKYDFKIRGIIKKKQLVNSDNDNKIEKYTIINKNKNYNYNNEYILYGNQITDDPCKIIDLLLLQVNELQNNYIELKRHNNKFNFPNK